MKREWTLAELDALPIHDLFPYEDVPVTPEMVRSNPRLAPFVGGTTRQWKDEPTWAGTMREGDPTHWRDADGILWGSERHPDGTLYRQRLPDIF